MATTDIERSDIERAVTAAYADADGPLDNRELYAEVAGRIGVQMELFAETTPLGVAGTPHSRPARDARWMQQTLKVRGLLERVDRGRWRLTAEGKQKLRRPVRGMRLLAFSTDLGLAAWGDCRDVIAGVDETITLCVTSPCYPIAKGRSYGQISQAAYVDWLCDVLEGVIPRLAPGGNIALILGQDVFTSGSPARSLYLERVTLALSDRFSLALMDRLVWHNPSKPPGPVEWASKARCQLNATYEYVLWFTNDPQRVIADNRRVLQPHTQRHAALLAAGGEQREATSSDGAYRIRRGASYAAETPGRIPRNVLSFSHSCGEQRAYKRAGKALGLPAHGAPAPLALMRFLVRFLSRRGDLVYDPMSGSFTTARAAELEDRRWLGSELYGEYIRGGAERFRDCAGFQINPAMRCIA